MSKLALFQGLVIDSKELATIKGGWEPLGFLLCTNADGSTTAVAVRNWEATIDEFNDNGELSPIVGCETTVY